MRCSKAQYLIELKLDNELPEAKEKALKLHLENCPQCRKYEADARELQQLLRNITMVEFPSWLHNRILDETVKHERKRVLNSFIVRWQTIPALVVIVLSLIGGWAIGKSAYSKVNPLPENASAIYSNYLSQTDSLNLVVFGESTLMEDLFYQTSEDYK
ncbi:MAG: anti-sigma factor [Candidatus Cloacimonadaceae bacterium]|nr:zf-HC2 domain-containing protein [Candidatus Cloacimonadota bacterium]MCB5257544.1 zf-HC2 domain-containing protein [Candidatus Cloacimonadota bacterium]MDD5625219.1 anti-sigma factor [Candidatus Cloacimonadota bacterium]MDY0111605.1 anti-sigma factor [Candidatus Syntrophosphaera sp.]